MIWLKYNCFYYCRYKTKKNRHQSNYEGKNWNTEPSYQNIITIPFLLIFTKQIISSFISQPNCSSSLSLWCYVCRLKWCFINNLLLQLLKFLNILKSDSFKLQWNIDYLLLLNTFLNEYRRAHIAVFYLHLIIRVSKLNIVIRSLQKIVFWLFSCFWRKKKKVVILYYIYIYILIIWYRIHIIIFSFAFFIILLTRSSHWSIIQKSKLKQMDQLWSTKRTKKLKNLNLLIQHHQRKLVKIVKLAGSGYISLDYGLYDLTKTTKKFIKWNYFILAWTSWRYYTRIEET